MQHGKAGEGVSHHQRRGDDLRQQREQPAGEAEARSRSHSATSVIGGSAVVFRSGQGRCSRPDVAVIFAASQRLSVSVIMATIAAAAGAIATKRIDQSFDIVAGRGVARSR